MDEIERVFTELRGDHEFVQQVRSILFWAIEPDESRDRKALVILAEFSKKWAEVPPSRLGNESHKFLVDMCDKIIEAGSKKDGPDMPGSFQVGLSFTKVGVTS